MIFSFSIRSLSQDSSINLRVFYSSFWYITVLKLSKLTHASDREIFMSQTQYPISCSNLSNECHHLFPCSHSVITDPIERKIDQNRNNDFETRKNRYNSSLSQRVRVSRGDRSTRNIQSRSTVSYSVQCVNERFVGWPRMYEIEIANWNFGILSQVFDFFSLSLSLTREFVNSSIHRNKVRILEKISRYDIYWAKLRSISSFSRNYNSQLEANTCDVCIWS